MHIFKVTDRKLAMICGLKYDLFQLGEQQVSNINVRIEYSRHACFSQCGKIYTQSCLETIAHLKMQGKKIKQRGKPP